jgi:hypothetical protein
MANTASITGLGFSRRKTNQELKPSISSNNLPPDNRQTIEFGRSNSALINPKTENQNLSTEEDGSNAVYIPSISANSRVNLIFNIFII